MEPVAEVLSKPPYGCTLMPTANSPKGTTVLNQNFIQSSEKVESSRITKLHKISHDKPVQTLAHHWTIDGHPGVPYPLQNQTTHPFQSRSIVPTTPFWSDNTQEWIIEHPVELHYPVYHPFFLPHQIPIQGLAIPAQTNPQLPPQNPCSLPRYTFPPLQQTLIPPAIPREGCTSPVLQLLPHLEPFLAMVNGTIVNFATPPTEEDLLMLLDSCRTYSGKVMKPPYTYTIWLRIHKMIITKACPEVKISEMSSFMREMWLSLSPQQKSRYQTAADCLEIMHHQRYPSM